MSTPVPLAAVSRLPAPGDNVAIAVRRLDAGTPVEIDGVVRPLASCVLEGHRLAVKAIAPGEALLSWGLPFGHALTPIAPGDYVCNASMLEALAMRQLGVPLPAAPNFADYLVPFRLDESTYQPGPPVEPAAEPRMFKGYRRPGTRGVGTRNTVVILGTTSRTASVARQLASRLQPLARQHAGIDGIVAVAHTEGGGPAEPNNAEDVLRALAGFMVHPNVGAVLAIDLGVEPITNARLHAYMEAHGYALADVPHAFLSVGSGLASGLAEGEAIVRRLLPKAAAARRASEPLSAIRIALQCGGSDAFSGVSGNPLAGAIVHELIRHGGTGVLCETDEVAGAEAYVMRNTKDVATAKAVLKHIEGFTERLSWHGVTPESNPSGGNKLRGLYNITLKSLGAVHKKDPRTPVDHVIDYADPLTGPGFYFMNSPGNDLEGIAGQVAAGCNLLLFVTGNGSITNFPFVPTLKITTTSKRHELLRHEMDINAGRYLEGESMEALAADAFDLMVETASGARTKGELAGHSQAQLWRNWRQTSPGHVAAIEARPVPDGHPLRVPASPAAWGEAPARPRTDRIGLVLPTSMCSSQIARLAAARLNDTSVGLRHGIDRFVALAHSEGCGFGGGWVYDTLQRTFRGYATHPNVVAALLLEHGCEKVPNDAMRRDFERAGLSLDAFGWASVQLDGGIDQSIARVQQWFATRPATGPAERDVDLGSLTIGVCAASGPDAATSALLIALVTAALGGGGTVLIPEGDPLVAEPAFVRGVLGDIRPHATLAYGQPVAEAGLHLVRTDTDHWVENVTGLAACGAHAVVGAIANGPEQGHPLIPVLQVAGPSLRGVVSEEDVDLALTLGGDPEADLDRLVELLLASARRDYVPTAQAGGFVEFQLTRGLLGVST